MTELQLEERIEVTLEDVPTDDDPKFCHIDDGSGFQTYCGRLEPVPTAGACKPYVEGEEVCSSCGRENCPTCVQMAALNEQLVD
jgi:hypothetical protein